MAAMYVYYYQRLRVGAVGMKSLPNISQMQIAPSLPLSYRSVPSFENMATFTTTVNGYPANTLFDCRSQILTVSPSFSHQIVLPQGNAGTSVAVITTTGVFSCLVNLLLGPVQVDTVHDLTLGRDWFNY
jgi:hypothetical protein